jgi:RNA recognition motif-containing protein
MRDRETTRLRGFGFVTFESEDSADRACERNFYDYKNKQIEVKKADPMGTRRDGPGSVFVGIARSGVTVTRLLCSVTTQVKDLLVNSAFL